MSITHFSPQEVVQGSEEWHALRCGLLTASEMKLIITPTLKVASNDKERSHLYELLGQRISGYTEPSYISDAMLRGKEEEIDARTAYEKNYSKTEECAFISNDDFGFTLGYSPDGLIGEDGTWECKSHRQKLQIEIILNGIIPPENMIQVQSGLLISKRKWCDFSSYCGGLPMITMRIDADEQIQTAIVNAATEFEKRLKLKLAAYNAVLNSPARLIPTERKIEQEIVV